MLTFNPTQTRPFHRLPARAPSVVTRLSVSSCRRDRRRLFGNNLAKPPSHFINLGYLFLTSHVRQSPFSHHRFGWSGRRTGSYYFRFKRLNGSWSGFQGPAFLFCVVSCRVMSWPGSQADNATLLIDIYTLTQKDPEKALSFGRFWKVGGEKVLLYHAPTFRVRTGNGGVVCVDMSLNPFSWSGLVFFLALAVKQVLCDDIEDRLLDCVLGHELTLHISGVVVTMSACLPGYRGTIILLSVCIWNYASISLVFVFQPTITTLKASPPPLMSRTQSPKPRPTVACYGRCEDGKQSRIFDSGRNISYTPANTTTSAPSKIKIRAETE